MGFDSILQQRGNVNSAECPDGDGFFFFQKLSAMGVKATIRALGAYAIIDSSRAEIDELSTIRPVGWPIALPATAAFMPGFSIWPGLCRRNLQCWFGDDRFSPRLFSGRPRQRFPGAAPLVSRFSPLPRVRNSSNRPNQCFFIASGEISLLALGRPPRAHLVCAC